jgi:hypothetical protein
VKVYFEKKLHNSDLLNVSSIHSRPTVRPSLAFESSVPTTQNISRFNLKPKSSDQTTRRTLAFKER